MRKQTIVSCGTVCVLSAIAFFLRWTQMNYSFEPDTGLLTKGSVWTTALTIVCAAAVIFIVFMTFSISRRYMPSEYKKALRPRAPIFLIASVVLGFMMVVGSLLNLLAVVGSDTFARVLWLMGILTGVCFPLIIMTSKKGGVSACAVTVIPALFYCAWLVASYLENAANPVIWSFSIEILAIASAVLGFYYLAGYPFDRPRPRGTVAFCLIGAFFSLTALGGLGGFAGSLIFAATALMQLLTAFILLSNAGKKNSKPDIDIPGHSDAVAE